MIVHAHASTGKCECLAESYEYRAVYFTRWGHKQAGDEYSTTHDNDYGSGNGLHSVVVLGIAVLGL